METRRPGMLLRSGSQGTGVPPDMTPMTLWNSYAAADSGPRSDVPTPAGGTALAVGGRSEHNPFKSEVKNAAAAAAPAAAAAAEAGGSSKPAPLDRMGSSGTLIGFLGSLPQQSDSVLSRNGSLSSFWSAMLGAGGGSITSLPVTTTISSSPLALIAQPTLEAAHVLSSFGKDGASNDPILGVGDGPSLRDNLQLLNVMEGAYTMINSATPLPMVHRTDSVSMLVQAAIESAAQPAPATPSSPATPEIKRRKSRTSDTDSGLDTTSFRYAHLTVPRKRKGQDEPPEIVMTKKMRRKERCRIAARKFRDNRKDKIKELEAQVDAIMAERNELARHVNELRNRIAECQIFLTDHKDCPGLAALPKVPSEPNSAGGVLRP